jgi:hypothetical protein
VPACGVIRKDIDYVAVKCTGGLYFEKCSEEHRNVGSSDDPADWKPLWACSLITKGRKMHNVQIPGYQVSVLDCMYPIRRSRPNGVSFDYFNDAFAPNDRETYAVPDVPVFNIKDSQCAALNGPRPSNKHFATIVTQDFKLPTNRDLQWTTYREAAIKTRAVYADDPANPKKKILYRSIEAFARATAADGGDEIIQHLWNCASTRSSDPPRLRFADSHFVREDGSFRYVGPNLGKSRYFKSERNDTLHATEQERQRHDNALAKIWYYREIRERAIAARRAAYDRGDYRGEIDDELYPIPAEYVPNDANASTEPKEPKESDKPKQAESTAETADASADDAEYWGEELFPEEDVMREYKRNRVESEESEESDEENAPNPHFIVLRKGGLPAGIMRLA